MNLHLKCAGIHQRANRLVVDYIGKMPGPSVWKDFATNAFTIMAQNPAWNELLLLLTVKISDMRFGAYLDHWYTWPGFGSKRFRRRGLTSKSDRDIGQYGSEMYKNVQKPYNMDWKFYPERLHYKQDITKFQKVCESALSFVIIIIIIPHYYNIFSVRCSNPLTSHFWFIWMDTTGCNGVEPINVTQVWDNDIQSLYRIAVCYLSFANTK